MATKIPTAISSGGWSLTIFDAALPDAYLSAAYDVFQNIPIPSGLFYMPLASLFAPGAAERLVTYLPGAAAEFICQHLARVANVCPVDLLNAADGLEFWVGVLGTGGTLARLHVDNDEVLRARSGVVVTPLAGTILHLGPPGGLQGGETMFDLGSFDTEGPHFMERSWNEIVARAAAPVVVPQRAGRMVVFRGDIPHAVAPVRANAYAGPRVAILANLWSRRITDAAAILA